MDDAKKECVLRIKRIISVILVLILLIFLTRNLWTNQFWPDGYYENILKYTEEESTEDFKELESEEEPQSSDFEDENDNQDEEETTVAEEETTSSNEEETSQTDEEDATDEVFDKILDNVIGLDYYNQLTKKQQKVYRQMQEGCKNFKSKVKIEPISEENYYVARYALRSDHPEFYWLNDTYEYNYRNGKVVEAVFNVDKKTKKNVKKIRAKAKKITDNVPRNSSTYKKIKYLYKSLCKLTYYKAGAHDQDLRSIFLEKKTVCNGYSEAFVYLCKLSGINCAYARGMGDNDNHAWNIVEIYGKYYWLDATWGDTSASTDGKNAKKINYIYLCMTDKQFFRRHKLDEGIGVEGYNKKYFKYPKCTDNSYNYCKLKGCYFTKYDRQKIKKCVSKIVKKNLYKKIELQFSNETAYKEAVNDLITQDYIYEAVGNKTKNGYSYTSDDKNYYLEIQFKR